MNNSLAILFASLLVIWSCSEQPSERKSNEIFEAKTSQVADKGKSSDVAVNNSGVNEPADTSPAENKGGDQQSGDDDTKQDPNPSDPGKSDDNVVSKDPASANQDLSEETKEMILNEKLVNDCMAAKAAGELKTSKASLVFTGNLSQKNQCVWKREPKEAVVAGEKTWTNELSLDASRKLCALSMMSTGSLKYDDVLAFTLNDKMLFWGALNPKLLSSFDGIYQYDFDKLYENFKENREYGCIAGSAKCEIPKTDTEGNFNVSFDELTNYLLAVEIEKYGARFDLHILGDNDKEKDCRHSGLTLDVEYQYIDSSESDILNPAEENVPSDQ